MNCEFVVFNIPMEIIIKLILRNDSIQKKGSGISDPAPLLRSTPNLPTNKNTNINVLSYLLLQIYSI